MQTNTSILALDVGAKRVGVALASSVARLPHPLTTLNAADGFYEALNQIIVDEAVDTIVVGLPRGLEGQHTAQTQAVEDFTAELRSRVTVPIYQQDEALTSQKAEEELEARGGTYQKGDIDALAATYILEDFLTSLPRDQEEETA
jgi:putative Holliday junction resolvase